MESLCLGSKQLEMITRQTTNTSVAPAEACNDGPTDSLSNSASRALLQVTSEKHRGEYAPPGLPLSHHFPLHMLPPTRLATSSKINALHSSGVSAGKRMMESTQTGALEALY